MKEAEVSKMTVDRCRRSKSQGNSFDKCAIVSAAVEDEEA